MPDRRRARARARSPRACAPSPRRAASAFPSRRSRREKFGKEFSKEIQKLVRPPPSHPEKSLEGVASLMNSCDTNSNFGKQNVSKNGSFILYKRKRYTKVLFNQNVFSRKWGQALCACVGPLGPPPFFGKNILLKRTFVCRLRL